MNAPHIDINGHKYSIGVLDAFKQFHVARRIAPILSSMTASFQAILEADTKLTTAPAAPEAGETPEPPPADLSGLASVMQAVAEVVARMPEEDVDYVLRACLAVAKRQDGERWARVMNGTTLMYQDIDMAVMMRITVATVKENLGSFFPMLLGGQQ